MPRPPFGRRPPRSSIIRILQSKSRAGADARRDATLVAPALWGGVTLGWFTTSGSNLIVSPPPAYIPENVGHASIAGLSLGVTTLPVHRCVATLDVTNLYRAQDLKPIRVCRVAGRFLR